jgi:hypothetical protein
LVGPPLGYGVPGSVVESLVMTGSLHTDAGCAPVALQMAAVRMLADLSTARATGLVGSANAFAI